MTENKTEDLRRFGEKIGRWEAVNTGNEDESGKALNTGQ